jgi:hypothetical protein
MAGLHEDYVIEQFTLHDSYSLVKKWVLTYSIGQIFQYRKKSIQCSFIGDGLSWLTSSNKSSC